MGSYLGEGKAAALGFESVGRREFAMFSQVFDAELRRKVRKELGRITLDRKGYIVKSRGFYGFPKDADGNPMLFLSCLRW